MLRSPTSTLLTLIAIPVALFTLFQKEKRPLVTLANGAAMLLILFAWRSIKKLNISRFDLILLRVYLIGFLDFAACLAFNSVLRGSYVFSVEGNGHSPAMNSFALHAVTLLFWSGFALAVLFTILVLIRIVIAVRDRYRPTRSLKATNV